MIFQYTYYTLTAFSIKVPMLIKRTLTTMQITQFVVGASYAMVHSFVSYMVPVTIIRNANAEPATVPTGSVGTLDSLRQLVFGSDVKVAAPEATAAADTVYVTQPCIATAGETFAIWLNVLYLAPLTYLFVSFFIASYVKRSHAVSKMNGKADRRLSNNVHLAEKAGWDAARGVEREVYGSEHLNGSAIVDDEVPAKKSSRSKRRA